MEGQWGGKEEMLEILTAQDDDDEETAEHKAHIIHD